MPRVLFWNANNFSRNKILVQRNPDRAYQMPRGPAGHSVNESSSQAAGHRPPGTFGAAVRRPHPRGRRSGQRLRMSTSPPGRARSRRRLEHVALQAPPAAPRHYCFIAIAEEPPPVGPARSPAVEPFSSFDDFMAWLADNHHVSFRNTVDMPFPGADATWNWTGPISGPADQATLEVGVQCQNMPVGSQYRFQIPGGSNSQGTWPSLDSGCRTVEQANDAFAERVTWPGGVTTTIDVTWWANGTNAAAGRDDLPLRRGAVRWRPSAPPHRGGGRYASSPPERQGADRRSQ